MMFIAFVGNHRRSPFLARSWMERSYRVYFRVDSTSKHGRQLVTHSATLPLPNIPPLSPDIHFPVSMWHLLFAGITSVSVAAHKGRQKIVKMLIAAQADVNIDSNNGSTPLIQASHFGGCACSPACTSLPTVDVHNISSCLFLFPVFSGTGFPFLSWSLPSCVDPRDG